MLGLSETLTHSDTQTKSRARWSKSGAHGGRDAERTHGAERAHGGPGWSCEEEDGPCERERERVTERKRRKTTRRRRRRCWWWMREAGKRIRPSLALR